LANPLGISDKTQRPLEQSAGLIGFRPDKLSSFDAASELQGIEQYRGGSTSLPASNPPHLQFQNEPWFPALEPWRNDPISCPHEQRNN